MFLIVQQRILCRSKLRHEIKQVMLSPLTAHILFDISLPIRSMIYPCGRNTVMHYALLNTIQCKRMECNRNLAGFRDQGKALGSRNLMVLIYIMVMVLIYIALLSKALYSVD